jgi:methionyl-tRNA synthetase
VTAPGSYFISNAIPYVNGRPHLGHAFEFVQTDCFARWHRATGRDVFYLSGSDENSLKNVLAAEKEGVPTQALVDRNVAVFEALRDDLALSYDYYVRTSVDPKHIEGAKKLWQALVDAGDVYSKSYRGLYCVGCEQFYAPDELVDGTCPEHGTVPDVVDEENWFFRLSRYAAELEEAIESDRLQVLPRTRKNEVLSFIRGGLQDFSISRSHTRAHGWGIPVPGDESQVMYVWMDALTNYITALGYATADDRYRRYWLPADTDRVHVIGKGVIRFHAVYWPAMLMAAGVPIPTLVFAHGYVTAGGAKLSKSSGSAMDPAPLLAEYGTDALRYFLLKEIPPTADADFDVERLVGTYNTDLANALGNLLNRTLTIAQRYLDGKTGQTAGDAIAADVDGALDKVREAMAAYDHRAALQSLWLIVRRANAYIEETEPWKLAKGDDAARERLATVVSDLVVALGIVGVALAPFLPGSSERLLDALGIAGVSVPLDDLRWRTPLGIEAVGQPTILFPRIEEPEAAS